MSTTTNRLLVLLIPLGLAVACNNPGGGDGTPTPSSPPGPKRVFVTSQTFNGDFQANLGGPSGVESADMACQGAADAASLGGSWIAWVSDNTLSAPLRLQAAAANGPWHVGTTTAGPVAFSNRASTESTPEVEINVDENGDTVPTGLVWTGTMIGGESAANHCLNWTDDTTDAAALVAHDVYGRAGSVVKTDDDWTDALDSFCLDELHLYCFEI